MLICIQYLQYFKLLKLEQKLFKINLIILILKHINLLL